MTETMRIWTEISFDIAYLIVVWWLVVWMYTRRAAVVAPDRRLAQLFTAAFALLALGDSGHVGFRVLAYALGGLDARLPLLGSSFGLVGPGALATAVTITFFYVLMLAAWRQRFQARYGWFEWLLLAAAALRLVLMALPANQWNNIVPPQPFSLIRNLPLLLAGLGVAFLILRSARAAGDRTFSWIGIMILVSYACYTPVILFVQQAPLIGMLMIPKTLAYVAIGFLAYRRLYRTGMTAPALVT